MRDCVTGRDEWVAINERWYKTPGIGLSSRTLAALADGVQHHHGDLSLRLLLVIRIRRPEFQGLLPEPGALLASDGPGFGLELFRSDLNVDLGIGNQVLVPARVVRCAAFRCDDDVAVTGLAVEQWEYEFLPRLAANRGQKQRWDRHLRISRGRDGVHVAVLATAGDVAVEMVDLPLRKTRGELGFSHRW